MAHQDEHPLALALSNASRRTRRRGVMATAALVLAIGAGALAGPASAAEGEPVLFLGVQSAGKLDKVASQAVEDLLQDRGENVLHGVPLTESDRRCRRVQCLSALSAQQKAALVLSGDVQPVAPGVGRTQRVVIHLFDARSVRTQGTSQYVPQDALQEMESLCTDCDDTKLGIVLTGTTGELLGRVRQQAAAQAPAVPPPVRGAVPPTVTQAPAAPLPPPAAPLPPANAQAAPYPVQTPPTGFPAWNAPPPVAPSPLVPAPLPAVTYQRPVDPSQSPDTLAHAQPKKGLSTKRKVVAAVFGTLGFGTLIASAILTGLDKRIDTNYMLNNGGSPCSAPENADKNCVFSFVRLYAPGYAIGGLLVGGMVLSLALPEKHDKADKPAQ